MTPLRPRDLESELRLRVRWLLETQGTQNIDSKRLQIGKVILEDHTDDLMWIEISDEEGFIWNDMTRAFDYKRALRMLHILRAHMVLDDLARV